MQKIDYEALLLKYMRYVADCEGITFVPFDEDSIFRHASNEFSKEELQELKRLEQLV